MIRGAYDLPPLTFDTEEVEAIAIGLRLIRRVRDEKLQRAARRVLEKVALSLSEVKQRSVLDAAIWVSSGSAVDPKGVDPALIRHAIREALKIRIDYVDETGARSQRVVLPLTMVYYVDATLLAAWCEHRSNFRHFRIERIEACEPTGDRFNQEARRLRIQWQAMQTPSSQ